MKNFVRLIVLVGLLIAGWTYRDRLRGLTGQPGPTEEEDSSTLEVPAGATQRGAATPHPAREAQARAAAAYPGLKLPNSALNKKFVALYKESQAMDPALLSRPDWPLQLAERAVVSLGGAALPRSTPSAQARTDKQVVMYSTSYCPACKKAKEYMRKNNIPFREIDVETSLSGKAAFDKLGGDGVPLIIVGEKRMTGFSARELEHMLAAK